MPTLAKRKRPTLTVTEIRTDQHRQIWLRCIEPNRWICFHRGSQYSSAVLNKVGPNRGFQVHSASARKLLKQLSELGIASF